MTAHTYGDTLKHRGLQPFLWTQFLGAFNDNLFKIVVSMLAVHAATPANAGRAAVARRRRLHPAVPALLRLRGPARRRLQQADGAGRDASRSRSSPPALGLVAFMAGHLNLTYVVLFLMALQATFFSPAKYGILPEMLPDRDLSRANGLLEMSTFVAIVPARRSAASCSTRWRDRLWIIGVVVVAIAVVGTALSLRIPARRAGRARRSASR